MNSNLKHKPASETPRHRVSIIIPECLTPKEITIINTLKTKNSKIINKLIRCFLLNLIIIIEQVNKNIPVNLI